MTTVDVCLPEKVWQDLVALGEREKRSPDVLLEQAVQYFLEKRQEEGQAPQGLQESFGIWRDRDDLTSDSVTLVEKLREEWDERVGRAASPV